jgi:hypothetical protein
MNFTYTRFRSSWMIESPIPRNSGVKKPQFWTPLFFAGTQPQYNCMMMNAIINRYNASLPCFTAVVRRVRRNVTERWKHPPSWHSWSLHAFFKVSPLLPNDFILCLTRSYMMTMMIGQWMMVIRKWFINDHQTTLFSLFRSKEENREWKKESDDIEESIAMCSSCKQSYSNQYNQIRIRLSYR